ncbi:MAG: Ni/Fe-hydrogenase cytochrome b subunit [Candidatus Wallbacteria bacterium]|nr:Ni/Fe-hydrogenase cytochrome b subunit [Candidatus Wallbacteria bacterium]
MTRAHLAQLARDALRYPGRLALAMVLAWGVCVTVWRFHSGLGAVTHLSDGMPWGLWIGFDVLCGVALAAGGFSVMALVHLFGLTRLRPIVPATVLTAFLGYILVSVGLLYDLGKPYNMWHVFIMHNPRSVMFEVAWCVILYTTVLAIEFSGLVVERLHWRRAVAFLGRLTVPAVLAGVLLSTLHQSSLGTLFLIVPGKLYKLWYSPYLPLMFFFSALAVGFAMVIFESYLSAFVFGRSLEREILVDLARILLVTVVFYLGIKLEDLYARDAIGALFEARPETYCFWLELALLAVPAALLAFERVRWSQDATFLCATMVVLGVVINRLNVSLVGTYAASGSAYWPSFQELSVSVFLVTAGVLAFGLAVRFLGIFDAHAESAVPAEHDACRECV